MHAYCDNLTAFGTDAKRVQELADRAAVGIEKEGFIVRERESAARYAISVGVEISGIKGLVATKPQRRWKLRK
eukprot:11221011-Heterocapsa_arctica.AAC.1